MFERVTKRDRQETQTASDSLEEPTKRPKNTEPEEKPEKEKEKKPRARKKQKVAFVSQTRKNTL